MVQLIAENRGAKAVFVVGETVEAGLVLTGAEIKSVRQRRVGLRGSHVAFVGGEPFVLNLKIDRYPYARQEGYDPKRARKILLRQREISRLAGLLSQKGVALVPLKLYIRNNLAKILVGVARVARKADRRRVLKEKELERQIEREVAGM